MPSHRRALTALSLALALLAGGPALAAAPAPAAAPEGTDTAEVRAQLRARQHTTLSAGLSAVVSGFPVAEGDTVAAGAVLASLECSVQQASSALARARLTQAQAKLRVAERMTKLNAASVLEFDLSRAEVDAARAEVAAIDATLRKCEIRAPFAGTVVAKPAQAHQHVAEGTALLELVDTGSLEVEMVVPSVWLRWLREGSPFSLTLDENGRSLAAKVDRIVGRVDPVSQTIRLLGRLDAPPPGLLPGMSGFVRFSPSGSQGPP
ncbi:efflux RND transporter periplasmic adaptor subunit [Azospirillum sp.]|uniref:efflux RND transporter periplasmic adaptor subunit n=1 Tax=Azospirillum sp. TaxID=34012 RepID=UPI002D3BDEC6|nr:efflux RND transporter periplasmic adaptor subunit [Azospirillum sp.]HYD71060.1 efflux RND transporter periplasmic adaptor subunit [Azospirillum sp.]